MNKFFYIFSLAIYFIGIFAKNVYLFVPGLVGMILALYEFTPRGGERFYFCFYTFIRKERRGFGVGRCYVRTDDDNCFNLKQIENRIKDMNDFEQIVITNIQPVSRAMYENNSDEPQEIKHP